MRGLTVKVIHVCTSNVILDGKKYCSLHGYDKFKDGGAARMAHPIFLTEFVDLSGFGTSRNGRRSSCAGSGGQILSIKEHCNAHVYSQANPGRDAYDYASSGLQSAADAIAFYIKASMQSNTRGCPDLAAR